MNRFCVED